MFLVWFYFPAKSVVRFCTVGFLFRGGAGCITPADCFHAAVSRELKIPIPGIEASSLAAGKHTPTSLREEE